MRTVEPEALEGLSDPEVLERFLRSVQAGPRSSRIDDVQVQWEPPLSETSHFEVRYR